MPDLVLGPEETVMDITALASEFIEITFYGSKAIGGLPNSYPLTIQGQVQLPE